MAPAYDYRCPECSNVIEVIRSVTDSSDGPTCHQCKVTMLKRFQATPAIFNGSGWAGKSK